MACIEDIEDIFVPGDDITRPNKLDIVPKSTKSQCRDIPDVQSFVPGIHKIFVKTWGCSHNSSDSEYMAGQLAAYGYPITDRCQDADLWLLNSCTVKSPAEDHFRNEITKARELDKFVVVAGCVPQGQPHAPYLKGLSVVGVQQIDRILEVVEETLKGNSVRLFSHKKVDGKKLGGASLDLPKIRRNRLIEIIAINTGCLNQCTYCKTKHARGNLGSYSPDEILARAVQSFKEGVVEMWLTSEDLGAYGKDIGVTLPQLLWRLIDVIPAHAMMRLGMTNPPYILEHLKEMSEILNHPRVYAFLHLPVQSASDAVLSDMKREYCRQDFQHVVDYLTQRVHGLTIATDVICGFPTETDEDFQETLDLVAHNQFPSLFINQFFPRPGTPAARLRRVPPQQIKKRTKAMTELFHSYHPYTHKVGEKQTVLVTEVSHDKEHFVAHNKFYEQVLVPMDESLMGKFVTVDIVRTGKHYLVGELVPQSASVIDRLSSLVSQATHCVSSVGDCRQRMPEVSNEAVLILLCGLVYFILKYFGVL